MRFAHFAALASFSFVAVNTFGCSEDPPTPAQGAFVALFSDTGSECSIASHNAAAGDVGPTTANDVLVNGQDDAEIECKVTGSGDSFTVEGTIFHNATSMSISVAKLSTKASKSNPAKGAVSYSSAATTRVYGSEGATCDVYFADDSDQTVDAGKAWLTFDCPKVNDGKVPASICGITGTVILEHCVGSPGNTGEEE